MNSNAHDVWTVQRVVTWSIQFLKEKQMEGLHNPRLDVELILASILNLDRTKLFMQLDRPLDKSEREAFKMALRRRAQSEPVAYIIGYRDFYRHRFVVNSSVLIPRPDTEILVEAAIEFAKSRPSPRILDVGTGSGCIALSLAAELTTAQVVAWDISIDALAVARQNADRLGICNVDFLLKDGIEETSLTHVEDDQLFDVIVSNPPYVAQSERTLMSEETLRFEPHMALFPSDDLGLVFYQKFAKYSQKILKPDGQMIIEIGLNQGEKVAQLFRAADWRKIKVTKDYAGHDRVVIAGP